MQYKAVESITSGDLQQLFGTASERKRLEFKSELPGGSSDAKREFVKDISALVNTEGGDIIFGIAEDRLSGTARAFNAVPDGQVESAITQLNQLLQSGLRPRIPRVEMQRVPVEPGKSVLLVRVFPSHIAPHQVVMDQSYRFYGRNTNGTYILEVDELRDKMMRQASIGEQMRAFRRARVSLIMNHPEDMPSPVEFERKLVVHYIPEQTFGRIGSVDASMFTNPANRRAVESEGPPTKATLGLSYRSNIDGYVFMNGLATDVLQFYVQIFDDGTIEFTDGAAFKLSTDEPVIYHLTLEKTLFRQYTVARKVLSVLGVEGRIAVYTSMVGVRDCTIKPQSQIRPLEAVGHSTAINRDPAMLNALTIEEIETTTPEEALEPLIQQIWRACAYDRAFSYKDGIYVANRW